MKKLLPKILLSVFLITLFFFKTDVVSAQLGVGAGPPPPPTASDTGGDPWIEDRDVTFAGRIAARSEDLLNWVIRHHQWSQIVPGKGNPFSQIYLNIQVVAFAFLTLFILAGAFLLIITRGKSLTVKKFAARFILSVCLIFFSFPLVSFLYDRSDNIQDFFFKRPNRVDYITSEDLLDVGFTYQEFTQGLRLKGDKYDEPVFISTLLVKLTAATYYAMFGILIVRKVILWFFIVISPIFPLLLIFAPLRNSAKMWAGEFFRWLLYAPLFAVLLSGLVAMWKLYIPLPLQLSCSSPDPNQVYPTSISILLGGPCQRVGLDNSLNSPDAFIQYVVALIMLWMVIIIPFILLKIFLDYFNKFSLEDSRMVKYLAQSGSPILNHYGIGGGGVRPPGGGPPPSSHPAGLAKNLPGFTHSAMQQGLNSTFEQMSASNAENIASAVSNATSESVTNITNATSNAMSSSRESSESLGQHFGSNAAASFNQYAASSNLQVGSIQVPEVTAQILNLTNLNIPTMKDISRYESAMMSGSHDTRSKDEINKVYEALNRIAGTSSITSPVEHSRYTEMREKIVQQAKTGNSVAGSILSASMPAGQAPIPEINRTQQVSVEDYEEVKRIWEENYSKMDVPDGPDGKQRTRKEWLQEEVKNIPTVIDYLMSGNPVLQQKGKDMVSKVLPFLLLGGFSKAEIVAYLKAKLQAAKNVLAKINQEEDKGDLVERENKAPAKPKTMEVSAEAELPKDDKKPAESTPLPDTGSSKTEDNSIK